MPKSKNQLAALVISQILLTTVAALLKLEGFEYAQVLLWVSLLLYLYTFFVLMQDILKHERENQLLWIFIVLIFFPVGALVYVVRK